MLPAGAEVKGAIPLPPTALEAWVAPATFEELGTTAAGVGAKVIVLGIAVMIAGFCLT